MEWDDVRFFLAVARSGSLTAAGRTLKTSAATVGRRIESLEQRLGARLFDRKQTGYELTDSGEAIRPKGEEAEYALLAVERTAAGRDLSIHGKVRVAATDDVAAHAIAPFLREFRDAYPGIALEIVAQMSLVNLTRREADVAVRGARPEQGDLVVRRAGTWPFGLYASRPYMERMGLAVGHVDFGKVEVINWTEEWSHISGGPWLGRHATKSAIAVASDSRRVHLAACKAGIGVAVLPRAVADKETHLVRLLDEEQVFSLDLWMLVHRDLLRTRRVRAVADFLCDVISRRR